MRPLSYMQSVIDRNVVIRCIPALTISAGARKTISHGMIAHFWLTLFSYRSN